MAASRSQLAADVRLEQPSLRWHQSWLAGIAEFGDVEHIDGSGLAGKPNLDALADPRAFSDLVERLRADALEETERPDGWVPSTIRWIIANDRYVGTISIRHRLTPALTELGGHLGASVIPSARRRGYARIAGRLALPIVQQLGLERVLVTAYESNTASRQLIEGFIGAAGLNFDADVRGATRRYWVAVSAL